MGGWWKWAMVSPDGVAPSRMVDVSASVNLPLHHKVQKFSSGTGSPGWSRKKGHKTGVRVYYFYYYKYYCLLQQPFSAYVISPTSSSVVLEKNLLKKVALLPSLVYV